MLSFFYEKIIDSLSEKILSSQTLLETVKRENVERLQERVAVLKALKNEIETLFNKITRCEIEDKEGDSNSWQIHS